MLGRLLRRTAVGRARPRPIELGRDPTASERALGKVPQPAPQLYRIWDLFPLNSAVTAEVFIKPVTPKHTEHLLDVLFGLFAGNRLTAPAGRPDESRRRWMQLQAIAQDTCKM